jgi:hypothetical protein
MKTTRMPRTRCALYVAALLIALSGAVLAQAPTSGPPMTNDDVVKLAKLGFGTDVIEAKIRQANAVDFKLEVDDLSKLKSAGVSQSVIAAMLTRSTAGAGSVTGQGVGPGGRPMSVGPDGFPIAADTGSRVKLVTQDHGTVDLRSIGGTMSTTFAYVTTLMHANFPGLKADVRIHDRRPTLLIRSPQSPKGRMYLVSADVDTRNDVRSVKMGNSRLFGVKNIGAPDSDNQIDYDLVAEGSDGWRLTPKKDLAPGEYGLWGSMSEMYDFGIDP